MRDLFIISFVVLLTLAAFKRPFMATLAYIYVDLVQPQRVSYYLLSSVPVSMIMAIVAVAFFLFSDDKRNLRFGRVQIFMLLLLLWVTFTTFIALVPDRAWPKWDPAWKAIAFGIFLPFVLSTRQRIEAVVLFLVLCIGSITIAGAAKTVLGGGGYGTLSLIVNNNTGLYESSTIATVAIATIPLTLYLYKHSPLFGRTRLSKLAAAGLVVSGLLIPIGTEARTGLVCIGVLALLIFIRAKRKVLIASAMAIVTLVTIPFLPDSFTERMATIKGYEGESSASGRLSVWAWTLDFVQDHPLGGGFNCYVLNEIDVVITKRSGDGRNISVSTEIQKQQARAFHSSYFEVLGEHGYPGIVIFLTMIGLALMQLRRIASMLGPDDWAGGLARAMLHTFIIYLVGSMFVGIAFQTTLYILLGIAASLAHVVALREQGARAFKRQAPLRTALAN